MNNRIKLHGVIFLMGDWAFIVDVKQAFKFTQGDTLTLLDKDKAELCQIKILDQRHGVAIDSLGICFQPLDTDVKLQDADYIQLG